MKSKTLMIFEELSIIPGSFEETKAELLEEEARREVDVSSLEEADIWAHNLSIHWGSFEEDAAGIRKEDEEFYGCYMQVVARLEEEE